VGSGAHLRGTARDHFKCRCCHSCSETLKALNDRHSQPKGTFNAACAACHCHPAKRSTTAASNGLTAMVHQRLDESSFFAYITFWMQRSCIGALCSLQAQHHHVIVPADAMQGLSGDSVRTKPSETHPLYYIRPLFHVVPAKSGAEFRLGRNKTYSTSCFLPL